jgi:hypothetical protein
VVLVNADPFRLRSLAGAEHFSPQFNTWLDSLKKDGTTMKVGGCVSRVVFFSARVPACAHRPALCACHVWNVGVCVLGRHTPPPPLSPPHSPPPLP